MRALPAAAIATLALLAGCATPPPPARAPMAAAPAQPAPVTSAGSVDGVYRAPPGGTSGSRACGTTRDGHALRVKDGIARMQTNTLGELSGPVAPDGSVDIQHGNGLLRGKISGKTFTGVLNFSSCSYDITLTRR